MSPTDPINRLIFSTRSVIGYGGNLFINVPVILQVDGEPLIETIKNNEISRTTRFSVYHSDGANLAEVIGSNIFLTAAGAKAGVELHFPSRLTVCTIGDRVLFEVRRVAAASITITAELFSPSGLLVCSNGEVPFATYAKDGRRIAGLNLKNSRIRNSPVGFAVTNDGRDISLGEK